MAHEHCAGRELYQKLAWPFSHASPVMLAQRWRVLRLFIPLAIAIFHRSYCAKYRRKLRYAPSHVC